MEFKDYFSGHSSLYAAYRPNYPDALYQTIDRHVGVHELAWDCATGNGQVARRLAERFRKVYASDISEQQLACAVRKENIEYFKCPAENTPFDDHQFDLVTVGQALHWFTLDPFYKEVKRTSKREAVIAVWGYGLNSVSGPIDSILKTFYQGIIGPYWDDARRHVEASYTDLPFPFDLISTPEVEMTVTWNLDRFLAYLNTWSAVRKYISLHQTNPVDSLGSHLSEFWNRDEEKIIRFPLFLKLGRIL